MTSPLFPSWGKPTFSDLVEAINRLYQMASQANDSKTMAQHSLEYQLGVLSARESLSWDKEDNVDASHGLEFSIYIPPNGRTRNIQQILLRIKLKAFRSYSSTTAAGGGTTVTSANGGGTVTSSANGGGAVTSTADGGGTVTSSANGGGTLYTSDVESTDYGSIAVLGIVKDDTNTAAHGHGITDGTVLVVDGGGTVTFSTFAGDTHGHDNYVHRHQLTDPVHTHQFTDPIHAHQFTDPIHTHQFTDPVHTHGVTIGDHSHGVTHGIYSGTSASGCTILVRGVDRTNALLGAPTFSADQDSVDITQFCVADGWNDIEIRSGTLGRIASSIYQDMHLTDKGSIHIT